MEFKLEHLPIHFDVLFCYFLFVIATLVLCDDKYLFRFLAEETIVQKCSLENVFLEISQYSEENTCARASFLIKLQA